MRTVSRRLLLIAAGALLPGLATRAAAELAITPQPNALPSVVLNGQKIHSPEKPPVSVVRFRDEAIDWHFPMLGIREAEPVDRDDLVPEKDEVEAQGGRHRRTYRWGSVTETYRVQPDRVDIKIVVENTSDRVLCELRLPLLQLALSADARPARVTEAFFGAPARARQQDTLSGPVVLPLEIDDQVLVACTPETTRPLTLQWFTPRKKTIPGGKGKHGDVVAQELADKAGAEEDAEEGSQWTLFLHAGGDRLLWHERYLSRQISPGQSDTFIVSLRVGRKADPLAPAADILAAYAQAHPMQLDWPDRRPVLRTFIGDFLPYHEATGPEFAKPAQALPNDALRERVEASARQLLADMQAVDAQGMIIWNVDGGKTPRIKYVGDPRMVEFMSPEMDALADAYFATFSKAGFRTGLCLRPSTMVIGTAADGSFFYRHSYPRDRDVVDVLDEKVRYAKRRWGCTLYYVDTNNVFAMPATDEEKENWPIKPNGKFEIYRALMNAEQWQELQRRHPDCLFIIEHTYPRYYTATIAYDQMNMGSIAGAGPTPALVRATWPQAFKALTTDAPVSKYYPEMVAAAANRDVIMANTPLGRNAEAIVAAQRQAKWVFEGNAKLSGAADGAALWQIAANPAIPPAKRLAALEMLAKAGVPPDAEALTRLLQDEEWALRFEALSMIRDETGEVLVDPLIALAADSRDPLRPAAIAALDRIGTPAANRLVELARTDTTERSNAFRCLAAMDQPAAVNVLLSVLNDESLPANVRGQAVSSLRRHVTRKDVSTAIIAQLGTTDWLVRQSAAWTLEKSTDPRALPALRKALQEAELMTPDKAISERQLTRYREILHKAVATLDAKR
jgi:hypothetical protein